MATQIEDALRALRRRAALAAFLGAWSVHLLVGLMIAGSAALLLRLLADASAGRAAFALCVLLATPFTAWVVARRRFLSDSGAAAWLDVRSGATGALLTEIEVQDPRWNGRTQAALGRLPSVPGIRVRPLATRSFAGVAFVLLALWIHVPKNLIGPTNEIFDASVETLREKLEALEEEVELDEETAEELEARMDRLEEEARLTENPEATFEALDEMEQRLEQEALDVREAAEQISESLAAVASKANEDPTSAQQELEDAMEQLTEQGLAKDLPSDLLDDLESQNFDFDSLEFAGGIELDPEMLEGLSAELAELLKAKLGELADAGLLDLGDLAAFGELGDLGDLGDLAELGEFELCEECKKNPGGT